MYRVMGGKLKVFSKYITLLDGTNSVYVDMDTGAMSYDSSTGVKVVSYTYDEATGDLTIDDKIGEMTDQRENPARTLSTWDARGLVMKGKLKTVDGYNEQTLLSVFVGFEFVFDYTTFAHVAVATKQFEWFGGNICPYSALNSYYGTGTIVTGSGPFTSNIWTALPVAGACVGQPQDPVIEALYGLIGRTNPTTYGTSIQLTAYNDTSITLDHRSYRKYLSFAKGMSGLFECSLGKFGGNESDAEPDGSMDASPSAFAYSMFNLKQ